MKDDILDYVFTQEEILVLVYKLIEKLHEITEEVNELQAQQSKDNETKLADMRVELEEFARQIGVFAQNTKDEQDRLVGELEKLDEVVEAKVSDASADIDAAVDEMEDRIEALRAEIPVLKEKTGSELMSLIGTIPFDRVEGLAEIARQLNSFSEVVHEERSDDSEFVKGELARVEERIDNLPTYEDKFKELNADMYKLSQELVNITPRIEVFVDGNKYASVHRLNFVGSTVTNDNGLVTVTNSGVAGATAWGAITGTLSDQTDLQNALNAKANALGADDNYVTDAEKTALHSHSNKTALDNVSGTNTGDETTSTIKTKLGITTLSGSNTGDQTIKDVFGITVDGGGSTPSTGTKGYRYIEQNCTITGWHVQGDASGSIVFDVKRGGTSIAGTEKPTLSSQQTNSDTTLTTWTTSLTAGDIIEFVIDSASTLTRATLTVLVTKI